MCLVDGASVTGKAKRSFRFHAIDSVAFEPASHSVASLMCYIFITERH